MFDFVNLTSGLYSKKRRTEAHLEAQNGNTCRMPCRSMPRASHFVSFSLHFSLFLSWFLHLSAAGSAKEELPPLEPEEEELDKVHSPRCHIPRTRGRFFSMFEDLRTLFILCCMVEQFFDLVL